MAVDPSIKQKADDIRTKVYGSEVRESLASGLEAMSSDVVETVGRQGNVESQFQDVIENTTDKDVISAPEIIAARNGESNLKARLDKEKNEVTAQLAQTETKVNSIENVKADKTYVDDLNENVNAQLAQKANEVEVYLKRNGININDFDEPTRQTFLEAQGIDVNYVLGYENVKGHNIANRSVTSYKRTPRGGIGMLLVGSSENSIAPNIDLYDFTLTIYPTTFIAYDAKRHVVNAEEIIPFFEYNGNVMTNQILLFNTQTNTFRFTTSTVQERDQFEIELMTISLNSDRTEIKNVFATFNYTVNGRDIIGKEDNEKYHIIDTIPSQVFNTNEDYEGLYTDFGNATAEDVDNLFNDLKNKYPDYITKELLGYTATDLPMYAYHLKPNLPNASYYRKLPKVYIQCGIHGYEHMNPLATYLMVKHMCEKWEEYPHLEMLRFNVEFIIVPVANPEGFNDFIRGNSNGVDINSNFPINWEEGDSSTNRWGGPSPASEIETQHLMALMDSHKDIDIVHDFHNFRHLEEASRFIWIPTTRAREQGLAISLISKMTRKWSNDFEFVDIDEFVGFTNYGRSNGTTSVYARANGAYIVSTLEVRDRWMNEDGGIPYSHNACKAAVETLVNMLMIDLKELYRS